MSRFFDSPEQEERISNQIETARQFRERASGNVASDPALVSRLNSIASQYPHVDGRAAYALASQGIDASHPLMDRVGKSAARVRLKKRMGWNDQIGRVAKVTTRTVLTALETPLQEIQRGLRAIAATSYEVSEPGDDPVFETLIKRFEQAGDSTGVIALKALAKGQRVDLGTGFLPGGEIRSRHERAMRRLKIEGQPITTGKLVAAVVSEPGARSYNILSGLVDAGIQIGGDPAGATLGAVSKVSKAKKAFAGSAELAPGLRQLAEKVGLINAARKTVDVPVAEKWLAAEGRPVIEYLTQEKNFTKMWDTLNRKVPVDIVTRLVDADTPEKVESILRPALGITVRTKPELPGAVSRVTRRGAELVIRRDLKDVRLLRQMPGTHLDLDNLDDAVNQLDRFQVNAKLPREVIEANNERMARTSSRLQRFNVLTDTLEQMQTTLKVDPHKAKAMTRIFTDYDETMRKYFVNEIGNNARVPGAIIDGAGQPLPSPHLYVEYLQRTVPLPDARDIRRATSRFSEALSNPAISYTTSFLDGVMQNVWKPLVLLRGAWTVRVVGEEQGRMGASGLDSLISHPLSAISWIVGRKKGLTGEVFEDASKAAADLDDYARAMSRGTRGFREPRNVVRTNNKTLYREDSEHYVTSWADELMQLRSDPIASKVAEGNLDEVKDWFWNGAGQGFRKEMGFVVDELLDRVGADKYIDSIASRIRIKTGGRKELVDSLSTGVLEGNPIRDAESVSKSFKQWLANNIDVGPEKVKGDQFLAMKGKGSEFFDAYDKAVESMFSFLMSKRTNKLSRSPAFRQFYWQRARELMPFMDEAAQSQTLKAAREAGLNKAARDKLARAATAKGKLSLTEADAVAKGFALDETKNLLYDLSEKNQLLDIARHIFPFGQAWAEILTRWTKIGVENPQAIRRGQQFLSGARAEGEDGQGWFYPDPTTGQEVFAYPGFEFISRKLLGVPIKLEGTVEGANLFSNSILPGFGPVVQIPAGWFIPDQPKWDDVKEVFLPFGEKDTDTGFLESFLPAWAQKWRQAWGAPSDERLFNNTVMDTARYLLAEGDYSTESEVEINELMRDAKWKAKALFLIRGAAQWIVPSAPSPEFLARDSNGELVTQHKIIEDYRKLQNEVGFEQAPFEFLSRYGEDALLYMQPYSRSVVAAPVTEEGTKWARQFPKLQESFPNTYGFFAPEGGDFDYTAYRRQFETGERQALTPEQAIRLANHRVARMQYEQAKAQLPKPNKAQREWLAGLKEALKVDYPGFDEYGGMVQRADAEQVIAELEKAARNKTITSTPAGQGLREYLQAREMAQQEATRRGLQSYTQAKSATNLRNWLRDIATTLSEQYDGFGDLFEQALSRELQGGADREGIERKEPVEEGEE